nr:EAL domain-containing protein [Rhodopila globiformis]
MGLSPRAPARLQPGPRRFCSFIDAVEEGVLVRSPVTGAIIDANRILCRMFGYTLAEFQALDLADLMVAGVRAAEIPLADAADPQGGPPAHVEWLCRAKDGRTFFCDVSPCVITVCGKHVEVLTMRDLTERKQLDEALLQSRERLELATASARIGIWDWDIPADRLVWDDRMYELYGIRAKDFGGAYADWLAGLHPNDRAQGDAAIKAAIDGPGGFNTEFWVVWPNGEVHGIEAHALVQRDAAGRAVRMIGVNWDITERSRATETIRLQAEQYAAMVATTADGFWLHDQEGRFHTINDALCRMLGYTRGELLARGIQDIEAEETPEMARRHMALIADLGFERFESRHRCKDGSIIDVEISASFWPAQGLFLSFARDITDRKRAEQALADSEARLKTVLQANVDGISVVETATKTVTFTNQAFCDMLGYGADEVIGIFVPNLHPAETLPLLESNFTRLVRGETVVSANVPARRKDGSILFADISAAPMTVREKTYIVACFHDVTARKVAEEQVARMACYDMLTDLANRRGFVDVLEHTIVRARRSGSSFAVLYLDLDHFKDVNDSLGHPVGDILLKAVAERLRASVRAVDTVARFGGDEFAIILNDIGEPANAALVSDRILAAIGESPPMPNGLAAVAAGVAEKIVQAVTEPIIIGGNRVYSGASIGIAVYGRDAPDAETILSQADVALYRAKAEQRGTYRFFTDGMDAEVHSRVCMGTELREAIASNQLFLEYQPQVDIDSGRIVGLEALVRWHHPVLGRIGPDRFIQESERNGLIVPLGRWVIREACRQGQEWQDAGIAPPLVAVNLSGIQFKMPLQLERDIATVVAEHGLPPRFLELELTESVLMEASRDYNDVLLRLRQSGHRIAIDDFGSGFSSLDYLRRYPVDRIKIAQTFIADIGIEPGNDAIVRAALGLARELGIEVVVEGVETAAQIALLKSWGGRIVQGYYFARPMGGVDIAILLRAGKIVPGRIDPVGEGLLATGGLRGGRIASGARGGAAGLLFGQEP